MCQTKSWQCKLQDKISIHEFHRDKFLFIPLTIALLSQVAILKDCPLKVFSKCNCHCHCICLCLRRCLFVGQVRFFITLIKCLKVHKSQRWCSLNAFVFVIGFLLIRSCLLKPDEMSQIKSH